MSPNPAPFGRLPVFLGRPRVWATFLLLARQSAIRLVYVLSDLRRRLPVGKLPREGPGEGANVLSEDVGNAEKNRLDVTNGNGVWKWGTALYVGKTGARPASSVTPFIKKADKAS